jgi:hypothetical protein
MVKLSLPFKILKLMHFSASIFFFFGQQHPFSFPPLLHFLQYLYPMCAGAKTCLLCLNYIWIMSAEICLLCLKYLNYVMHQSSIGYGSYFLGLRLQARLEKVHKTGKQVVFWENT